VQPLGTGAPRSDHGAFQYPGVRGAEILYCGTSSAGSAVGDYQVLTLGGGGGAAASYTTYRSSCPGSVGTPFLTNLTTPRLGQRLDLQITGLAAFRVGYLIFGFSDQYWGLNPLPVDLAPFGAAGCHLNIDPLVSFLVPSDAAGVARSSWRVWTDPVYLGVTFYNQYVSLDAPAGRALPIATSNAGRGIVGF
jgi:hypothetical protein